MDSCPIDKNKKVQNSLYIFSVHSTKGYLTTFALSVSVFHFQDLHLFAVSLIPAIGLILTIFNGLHDGFIQGFEDSLTRPF